MDELPARIERLENKRDQLQAQLAHPASMARGTPGMQKISTRLAGLEQELKQAHARWEALEAARAKHA